jgi:hydroxymethylbilane synthase
MTAQRSFARLGTRGSPLALAQTREVAHLLARAHGIDPAQIEIVTIRTTGDVIQDRPLAQAGGKGLFTKELDSALIAGEIDAAVHSSKDLPTILPDEIVIAGFLPREDVRDVFVSAKAASLAALPRGASLGTASLRRQAQALRLRPDLRVTLLRGNVETRLRKAEAGEIDATLLALAGLKRLGLAHRVTAVLEIDAFLPAVGQGAIGLTIRAGDADAQRTLAPILDPPTAAAIAAERAFLRVLDGSCRTPIAGHAEIRGAELYFRGLLLRPDGSEAFEISRDGPRAEAEIIGRAAGEALLVRAPADILAK